MSQQQGIVLNMISGVANLASAAFNSAKDLVTAPIQSLRDSSVAKTLTTGAAVLGSYALEEATMPNTARADFILYSSTPDTTLGTGIGNMINGGANSSTSRATFMPIIGNGQDISEIAIYWQYGSSAGGNTGSYEHYDWIVGMVLSPNVNDTNIHTVANSVGSGSGGADYRAYFSNPLPGYDIVRSTNSNGVNNHLAVFDLTGLNFQTIQGQEHWLFVVPIQYNNSNTSLGAAYGINNPANMINYFDRGLDSFGTRRYDEFGAPRNGIAGYIQTSSVPEPSSALLLGSLLTSLAFVRYRKE
jgi:hypothetical protein